ncbi:uncharacterized protein LOC133287451 [Gastrolobium bilobum]|uniref:uncharacterized protein LOC133287451 n=1 Tax=Gastrolobium bilobum TaxID=150636 RepID=UPI002AB01649|nr:uncharacterized protein LOC133287451 [Gastrolobium bilobum]
MAENQSRLEESYDYEDTTTSSCGCFCGLWSRWYGSCKEEQEAVKDDHNYWLVKEVKKVKALSEILVGPKGKKKKKKKKTFILGRLRKWGGRRMQFRYDPESYALNFDDGIQKECDGVYLNFSARFACPLGQTRRFILALPSHKILEGTEERE